MNYQKLKNTLKAGFIGGGIDSAVGLTHFLAARLDNKFCIEAGAFSRNKEKNIESGKQYLINPNRLYDDWRNLLVNEKDKLDVIIILTPIPDHYEIVIECLEMGYDIICEKALSNSSSNVRKIIKTRLKNNNFLSVTYNYIGFPMVAEMKRLVSDNFLGNILHFQIEMPQEGFIKSKDGKPIFPQKWRLTDQFIPTIYLDLGVHLHHLIFYLIGKYPLEVVGIHSNYGNFNVIDNVSCIAKYENKITGQFWFSKSAAGLRNGLKIQIFGTLGSCTWSILDPENLNYYDINGTRKIIDNGGNVMVANQKRYLRFKPGHPAGYIEAFANYYFDIANQIQQYKKYKDISYETKKILECSLNGMIFFESLSKSIQEKKWIKVINYKGKL